MPRHPEAQIPEWHTNMLTGFERVFRENGCGPTDELYGVVDPMLARDMTVRLRRYGGEILWRVRFEAGGEIEDRVIYTPNSSYVLGDEGLPVWPSLDKEVNARVAQRMLCTDWLPPESVAKP